MTAVRSFEWMLFATLFAVAASAQAATVSELGRKAVIEHCPELMFIDSPLAEERNIIADGYTSAGIREHPRAGTVDIVEVVADDGKVWIANSRDSSFCQVVMEGDSAKAGFDALFLAKDEIATGLRADDTEAPQVTGLKTTNLRTDTIDGLYLGVQFIDPTEIRADAPLMIQQYALEEE